MASLAGGRRRAVVSTGPAATFNFSNSGAPHASSSSSSSSSSSRRAEKADDENAGRGVTRVLAFVALMVVLLIAYKSAARVEADAASGVGVGVVVVPSTLDTSATLVKTSTGKTKSDDESEESIAVEPTPRTPQERVERDESALGVRTDYPVELLRDDNGTRAHAPLGDSPAGSALTEEDEENDEVVRAEVLAERKQAKEYAAKVKQEANANAAPPRGATRVPSLGNLLFSDGDAYEAAPFITLPPDAGQPFKGMWDLLTVHEDYFAKHPHKRYVPRLAQTISRQTFHQVFRITSTPVIIPFEHARALGFITQAQTLDEMQRKYPYDPNSPSGSTTYNPNSGRKAKLDLGPALYAIAQDAKLEKIAIGVRNFPRNLQLSTRNLAALGVSRPPYIQRKRFQPTAMWFGTSTSDTKFHHDCCDNFVMMIAGVKRWYLAPVTDWRHLKPIKCEGDHQSLCWASVPYPLADDLDAKSKATLAKLNSIIIDLQPSEMLYLPAGWWHFIRNLGPNVMLNHWTYGCENVGLALELDPTRKDRKDFANCPAAATAERAWRARMDGPLFGSDGKPVA